MQISYQLSTPQKNEIKKQNKWAILEDWSSHSNATNFRKSCSWTFPNCWQSLASYFWSIHQKLTKHWDDCVQSFWKGAEYQFVEFSIHMNAWLIVFWSCRLYWDDKYQQNYKSFVNTFIFLSYCRSEYCYPHLNV